MAQGADRAARVARGMDFRVPEYPFVVPIRGEIQLLREKSHVRTLSRLKEVTGA